MKQIRVLVADKSLFVRQWLTSLINHTDGMNTIETVADGRFVISKILEYHPDVIILGINMPKMSGLTILKHLMLSYPSRVLIISSQKSSDVDTSIQALRLGALDFIVKPVTLKNGLNELNNEILNKIRVANAINPKGIRFNSKINTPRTSLLQKRDYHNLHFDKLVVIGSSTGGPAALEDILMRLPDDFSYPVIIAQHIPHNYTDSFVESLDKISKLKVKKVENLESFVPGFIYIAPGGFNLHLKQDENKVYAILTSVDDNYGIISPSVDCLFSSAAKINKDVIACLLTGLGNDGTEGIKEIYDKKGITIAQDQESSLVYSMPEHAISGGYIQYTMSLGRIPDFLIAKSLSTM